MSMYQTNPRHLPCIDLETVAPTRKGCAVTRSFAGRVEHLNMMQEAIATHATRLGEKLCRHGLATDHVTVFFHTSLHDRGPARSVSLADLGPWLKTGPYTVNDRFKGKVLTPGLIDPHMQPMLCALQFGTFWITPEAWDIMGAKTSATIGHGAYVKGLRAAFAASPKTEPMLMTSGYSQTFHEGMSRAETPLAIQQRVLDVAADDSALSLYGRDAEAHDAFILAVEP